MTNNLEHDTQPTAAAAQSAARRMPAHVRDVLTWLAHVIDAELPLRTVEGEDEYAARCLDTDGRGLIAAREPLTPFTLHVVLRALAADMRRQPPQDIAGLYSDEAPQWNRLPLDGVDEMIPVAMLAFFAPDTLAKCPLVVAIEGRHQNAELVVHARAADGALAAEYLQDLIRRAHGPENYLRGRYLYVKDEGPSIVVTPMETPTSVREDVVLSAAVWHELDVNVRSLFTRRALLGELGLGCNRGVLVAGPPGVGKSALSRVLASELVGDVTVAVCTARTIAHHLRTVYDEMSRLAPALVLLEDIDLVVGKRGAHGDDGLHDFLAALDGVMSTHDGVVTLATTNNPKALDDAAVRAARFDRLIEIPLPDVAQRRAILERYLGRLAAAVDVRLVAEATNGASGADLRELVQRAVLEAGEDVSTASLTDVMRDGGWAPYETGLYM